MVGGEGVKEFSGEFLDVLSTQAIASPRLRQHRNLHTSYAEPCQRFFNAIEPGSYLRPHRQALIPRSKLLIAIRGRFALMIFDDEGAVTQIVRISPGESMAARGWAVGAEVPPGHWNTVVSLATGSVLLEIKAGPYDPNAARELAPWAPPDNSPDVLRYLKNLEELVANT